MSVNEKRALGLSDKHLSNYDDDGINRLFDEQSLGAFIKLQEAAARYGFSLHVISAYRGFVQQQHIWQEKLTGKRTTHDDNGNIIAVNKLSLGDKVNAIIRWSAIPGLSRHHFGTDLDLYDASSMNRADVKLTPSEVETDGPCGPMHDWLDECIALNKSFGFYRPFTSVSNTVAEERWHLSYLPSASRYLNVLTPATLAETWQYYKVPEADFLVENKERLFQHFLKTPISDQPDWVKAYF